VRKQRTRAPRPGGEEELEFCRLMVRIFGGDSGQGTALSDNYLKVTLAVPREANRIEEIASEA
jgi:hypothetical protein